ncbi:prenyltransferase/squalene oxidase repeat-containing protein [Glaciimonas sp. PAMC28666]|uniref:prenyltransferase/squalene oxidase repeat-containing protein n=1 Tax=Glaciimonas sp. PAMC28666 TaxID=2807626 RepID=UPI001962F8BD|nr:prenyltransferase/squalene oxidase repeat-containing protein [Glaciimonas sp. PAMC28666]QRX84205.1 hypothetical protein JQN73_08465 [Glaciimonas sp. PAMC28666]
MLNKLKCGLKSAVDYLISVQSPAGEWEGEVYWCPVPTAQVVFTYIIIGRPIPLEEVDAILHHFKETQRSDGGWGLHPESPSYRYVTTLVYVAARLLGMSADVVMLQRARSWLTVNSGGVDSVPTFGKVWLAMLGLYDWQFVNVYGLEFFLVPQWIFFSPERFSHVSRSIFRSLAYLKSIRLKHDLGLLGQQLKHELYGSATTAADVRQRHRGRHTIAETDVFCAPGRGSRMVYDLFRWGETLRAHVPGAEKLREKCRRLCLERIRVEQRCSEFQGVAILSSLPNILIMWQANDADPEMHRSIEALSSYRWNDASEGARYALVRSVTWDTAFTLQALARAFATADVAPTSLRAGYQRLLDMQANEELTADARAARDINLGGWCFGDETNGWTASDCTAESIIALLDCHRIPNLVFQDNLISKVRLRTAIDFLLSRQNIDGGFGSFERRRGWKILANINPSEIYGPCLYEASYIECSASALRALCACATHHPDIAAETVATAIASTTEFLLRQQRPDGTWFASWGVNLIYAAWLAVEALRAAQIPGGHPGLRLTAQWLRSIQRSDGGWGEHFSGCHTGSYVPHTNSLVSSTAWASLALMAFEAQPSEATERGIEWLLAHQNTDGSWRRDAVNGVFLLTSMLDYRLYNAYFPILALSRAAAISARDDNKPKRV